jgi:translation initiation factor IF-2
MLRGLLDLYPTFSFTDHYNLEHLLKIMTDSSSSIELVLKLSNPFLIFSYYAKSGNNISAAEEKSNFESNPESSVGLNLLAKPFPKPEKKIKKIEKDEDKESDIVKSKFKTKKKLRTKVEFEEDYDTINDGSRPTNTSTDVSSLSLERPVNPTASNGSTKFITNKQKVKTTSTSKKKKGGISNNKKGAELKSNVKPETVSISRPLTIQELSGLLVIPETDIIRSLFFKGISVTMNQFIDVNTAVVVGKEFEIDICIVTEEEENKKMSFLELDKSTAKKRAPIIAVMGHVDHGKTSLLDRIRKTQLAKKESGGITQKLGAYEVEVDYKEETRRLVFLDTPGHEAFSGMRSRGIQVTDVVILVVAADDGVRPQTIEAINYIQALNVPVIVAINKIDKEDANIENIKQELAKYNLVSESWGGDTLMIPISAKQGTNIETLLEMILLIDDVESFTADPNAMAQGTVLESYIDRTKGPIANLLVQNGTLKVGDILVAGDAIAKVRGIINSEGEKVQIAPPSSPVLIWGLSKPPSAGETFSTYYDEKEAKGLVQKTQEAYKSSNTIGQNLTETYSVSDIDIKGKINLIIKTDIQGSVEALVNNIYKLSHPKVQIRILYASPGEITETDIDFAETSRAIVLAFNTTLASGSQKAAKNANVTIKESDVIYDLFDYVQHLIDVIVGPEYDEHPIGSALVKSVFPLGKSYVAGSLVVEGKLVQECHIKILRNKTVIYEGVLDSLKRLKEDVLEVKENVECGVFVKEFDTWFENDEIKAFNLVQKKRSN